MKQGGGALSSRVDGILFVKPVSHAPSASLLSDNALRRAVRKREREVATNGRTITTVLELTLRGVSDLERTQEFVSRRSSVRRGRRVVTKSEATEHALRYFVE